MKNKVIFPSIYEVGPRNWGQEFMICSIPGVLTLKKLVLNAGHKGGLQYHRKKNECGYIISGKLLIRFLDDEEQLVKKTLCSGDVFHFPPMTVHQEEAITDCVIIEASSPHLNDRVRVEKLLGLIEEDGLPTTELKDIIDV